MRSFDFNEEHNNKYHFARIPKLPEPEPKPQPEKIGKPKPLDLNYLTEAVETDQEAPFELWQCTVFLRESENRYDILKGQTLGKIWMTPGAARATNEMNLRAMFPGNPVNLLHPAK